MGELHRLGVVAAERAPADAETAPAGLAPPLAGGIYFEGLRCGRAFRCGVREWSLNAAAWVTDVFVDALRATGMTEPVLITISAPSAG
ncbi:hypothetical protein [Planomonospora parontospora]|uniref:hypothetical protein n=1 Tax=Planomonospora parontospora TaxID=58119 RepID=UPI001E56FEC7|nr:hypothetical protein [Planomonospora parontospora]